MTLITSEVLCASYQDTFLSVSSCGSYCFSYTLQLLTGRRDDDEARESNTRRLMHERKALTVQNSSAVHEVQFRTV